MHVLKAVIQGEAMQQAMEYYFVFVAFTAGKAVESTALSSLWPVKHSTIRIADKSPSQRVVLCTGGKVHSIEKARFW